MKNRHNPLAISLALALAGLATPVLAHSAGDWTLGVGVHQVNPKSGNGALAAGTLPVNVASDTKPTITLEYFVRDNLGIEVLAALPFKHDIAIDGLGTVGSTKHLPPTVSLQYHFNSAGTVSPFVGAGINYTTFFSEATQGALAASKLKLGDSWAWRRTPALISPSVSAARCASTCAGPISIPRSSWTGPASARSTSIRWSTAPPTSGSSEPSNGVSSGPWIMPVELPA